MYHDSPEHWSDDDFLTPHLFDEVREYYDLGLERDRLSATPQGRLELIRSQELILRYLPPAPCDILDVGGGPGIYACWLARLGYNVHLVDPIPLHVEQALELSASQPDHPLASASVGDARHLDANDESVDAVLMMGPLYHLPERDHRAFALHEAYRASRANGVIFATGPSRFASTLDGLRTTYITDPAYQAMVTRDLADGQHFVNNPVEGRDYFTTSYFFHPGELRRELATAGFSHQDTLPIQGPAWLLSNLDYFLETPERTELLLQTIRSLEAEPSLLGASSHLMTIGVKNIRR